jgi:hypothetical protein
MTGVAAFNIRLEMMRIVFMGLPLVARKFHETPRAKEFWDAVLLSNVWPCAGGFIFRAIFSITGRAISGIQLRLRPGHATFPRLLLRLCSIPAQ